jgi:hypothetical protein
MSEETHEQKVLLYVLGTWEELVDAGLAHPAPQQLTVRGRAAYDQLAASGFKPSRSDIAACMQALIEEAT